MPWSLVVDGTVRDIVFREKRSREWGVEYQVYVGEDPWGNISWRDCPKGWTAVSYNRPKRREPPPAWPPLKPDQALALLRVGGFRTREAAATYIIKHHGHLIND